MAQTTSATTLREKGVDELKETLVKLQREQYVLRMQAATGQLGQPHLMQATRRDIARLKTILNEKAAAAAKPSGNQGVESA